MKNQPILFYFQKYACHVNTLQKDQKCIQKKATVCENVRNKKRKLQA